MRISDWSSDVCSSDLAVANGRFALGGEISLALVLMLIVFALVMVWFAWFILKQCSRVERDQMLALMALIFLALVFFTLYEQTYGSWVAFTDRLMTKDLFPSFVAREGTPMPWSIASLLLAQGAFYLAMSLGERHRASHVPRQLGRKRVG